MYTFDIFVYKNKTRHLIPTFKEIYEVYILRL